MAEKTPNDSRETQASGVDNLLDRAWNLLKSMKFAIILLLVITAASIFNLFANEFIVPARGSAERAALIYEQAYGGLRADLLMFFQMHAPYTSWWYTLLLGLLLLSLVVCVIDRAPLIWRQAFKPALPASKDGVRQMAESAEIKGEGLRERIPAVLGKAGFRLRTGTDEGPLRIDAVHAQWARWGAWLVHIGFVLLVLGGAMIARGEYNARVSGLPGEMLAPSEQAWGFNVRVDDFVIEYHPILEGQWVEVDGRIISRVVDENKDGTFDVETFSPRMGPMNRVEPDRISNRIDRRMQGGRLDAGNIADYLATLTVIDDGQEVKTETIEVNKPLRYEGYRFYQSAYNDQRTDAQGRWTTIINVRRDDGAPFVWSGILVVSIGLVLGLYFVPQRIAVYIEGDEGKQHAVIGGRTERSRTIFASKFADIVKRIERGESS
jgi:cytochrome c biogenesis protein ResB